MNFLAKIKNLLRYAQVTGPANNSQSFPIQQMTAKGKVFNSLTVFPYGMYANCASIDTMAMVFSVDGQEENKAAIPFIPMKRPKNLQQNEVAFYHPYSGTQILFKNDGTLEISTTGDTPGNVIINSGGDTEVNTSGNTKIIANDQVYIDATNDVNVSGANINLNGNVTNVVTTGSINPLTGLPFPNGNPTVKSGA